MGKLDNTLVIYISGDNGSSPEGTLDGTPNEVAQFNGVELPGRAATEEFYDAWGSDKTYTTWPWAGPGRSTRPSSGPSRSRRISAAPGKACAWPGPNRIKDAGGIRHQFHHVIDIVPTILEATGIPAPGTVNGIAQKPIEGVSMAYTWDKANAEAPSKHKTQYFEMFGNRAHLPRGLGGLHHADPGSLAADHLAAARRRQRLQVGTLQRQPRTGRRTTTWPRPIPTKLNELQELFWVEAAKYQVLPLDNSLVHAHLAPGPVSPRAGLSSPTPGP